MGNILCDCDKRQPQNNPSSHQQQSSSQTPTPTPKSEQFLPQNLIFPESPQAQHKNNLRMSIPSKQSHHFNKSTTLDEFWKTVDSSTTIGRGQGNLRQKYTFHEKIGEGQTSVVYKATLKNNGELRAIKILQKPKDISFEKQIIAEIDVLESLDHPNIIKLYEFYVNEDFICLVEDLGKGGNLSFAIEKGILNNNNEQLISEIMFQLLSAVNYCHKKSIMHRYLKLENILLNETINVDSPLNSITIKLTNFGTSKMFKDSPKQKQTAGSPYYIAPEVLDSSYNEKCDLWSCGVILYLLLSGGIYPFNGETRHDILNKIKIGKYDINILKSKNVSDGALDLLQKLLKVDPNERLSADKALQHSWFVEMNVKEKLSSITNDQMQKLFDNIFSYKTSNSLQLPVINYLVHHSSSENFKEMEMLFNKIDINNDGTLGKNEFIHNVQEIFSSVNFTNNYLETIFTKIDVDNSGKIGYREFICAAIDKQTLLNNEQLLNEAFSFFDKDKSGSITIEEIKKAFGKTKGFRQKDFMNIMKEIDKNDDASIDLNEFKKMMQTILK